MAVAGVILGSLLWALLSRSFRFEWFASFKDFLNHLVGAVLMGFGGVLALGAPSARVSPVFPPWRSDLSSPLAALCSAVP